MQTQNTLTSLLQYHPLSLRIYGESEPASDLIESIGKHGILTPLTITHDYRVVSGNRRFTAAKALDLADVPTLYFPSDDELDIEEAVIEANVSREKSELQKGYEFRERLRIESVKAERRRLEALAGANEARWNKSELSDEKNFSHRIERAPQARDYAAAAVGWSGFQAEKAVKVIEYAESTGDTQILDLLNNKSVHSAYAEVKRRTGEVKAPPFNPQYANIWHFNGPTPGMGIDYPGRIPGDILRNLFWLYTQPYDHVYDLFAGGGVTLDALDWWNGQPDLWKLQGHSYDLVPARDGIQQHDMSEGIPEFEHAGLVFLDPPYWKQKRGEYSAHATNLANLPLDEFHYELLSCVQSSLSRMRAGGHVALIIGATQNDGEFVDHVAWLLRHLPPCCQRIIVPYTTQQFSGAEVALSRNKKFLLKGYRDLLIWEAE